MSDSLTEKLQQAISLHQSKNILAAELAYLDILRENPNNPDANHNLGMLRVQQGRHIDALALLNIPIVVDPSRTQYWVSYINTLIDVNEHQLAREILDLAGQYGIEGVAIDTLRRRLYPPTSSGAEPTSEQITDLVSLFGTGNDAEVESGALRLTQEFPEHFFGWKVLGTLYTQQSRFVEAEQAYCKSLNAAPHEPEVHNNLGSLLMSMGRLDEAVKSFEEAIRLYPDYAEGYNNLGNAQAAQKQFDKALDSYARALKIKPNYAQVHFNMGTLMHDAGRLQSAISSLQCAIEIDPKFAQAHYNLGNIFMGLKEFLAAIASYQKAVDVDNSYADAYYNLAMTYKEYGHAENAIINFRWAITAKPDFSAAYNNLAIALHQVGLFQESADNYRKAIEIEPNSAVFYNNLGLVLHDFEQAEDVVACYRHAIQLDPSYADVYNNLGNTLYELGQQEEAIECYRKALSLNPSIPQGYYNYGTVLRDMGRIDEAVEQYLQAIKLQPDFETGYHALLFCINYHPTLSGEEIFSHYQAYRKQFEKPLRASWKNHPNDRAPSRRLRVGYVSATLQRHSCHHFLYPLLKSHDKNLVEIFIYAQLTKEDECTEAYKSCADHWIPIRGMGNALLAERIRADEIDILVDISGHTGHNRLQAFARKPAPVSLHWLDFGYTTGLESIDYYLTDEPTVPKGAEHLFSETPWRLPVPAYAYCPAEGMGSVNELPALHRGYVTFGTLTRAVRINVRTIHVWSEILKEVPNSRLVINSGDYRNETMRELLLSHFSDHGIARERLDIGNTSPPWDVLRGVDIGLDCFPHNSGTTLFETLYMGIPFVTLASRPSVGRLGASILHGLGHPEWIAETEEEYIAKAVALAGDLANLGELRGVLRQEMEQSPLMDEVGFARAVEDAYRQMWEHWCSSEQIFEI